MDSKKRMGIESVSPPSSRPLWPILTIFAASGMEAEASIPKHVPPHHRVPALID
jgi:hypothetical protein